MDNRLPDDTLFWIMEEDFRFWPPHADPDHADDYEEDFFGLVCDSFSHENEEAGASSSSTADARYRGPSYWKKVAARPGAYRPGPSGRQATRFFEAPVKGSSREDDPNFGFFRDVCDMVRIATLCHRRGVGDFIWVSWCPVKAHPSRIGHGSACLLVTKHGFETLNEAVLGGKVERGHIDLVLQAWLRQPGEARAAGACYLYPPIGSFTEHASGCDPAQFGDGKTRPSGFFSGDHPCHGARVSGDAKERQKFMIQWAPEWKNRDWIAFPSDEELHEGDEYIWKSFEEPTAFVEPALLDQAAAGAEQLPDRAGPGRGERDKRSPNPGRSQREKRAYRSFHTLMAKRCWVTDKQEALCVCSFIVVRFGIPAAHSRDKQTRRLQSCLVLTIMLGLGSGASAGCEWADSSGRSGGLFLLVCSVRPEPTARALGDWVVPEPTARGAP